MEIKKAIEIIENEKKCVIRKTEINCSDCANCDLVKTDKEILETYDFVIKVLKDKEV